MSYRCSPKSPLKSIQHVKNKISHDIYNALIFKLAGNREVYLVGGYIRDVFRGINSSDRDYIVRGNIVDFVVKIQKVTSGKLVVFKEKQTVRLVLKNNYTFDFIELKNSLKVDLSSRDFTINAIAWSPEAGIIDIANGISDLRDGIVRCISIKNMLDDPVRMMRAYRFSAELNGKINVETREIIKRYHKRILSASSERITSELFLLLNTNNASKELLHALKDKILPLVLSCSHNRLLTNVKALYALENELLYHLTHNIKAKLHTLYSQNLTYKGLLSLNTLLLNELSRQTLERLTISKKIRKRLSVVIAGIDKLKKIKKIESSHLFKLFQYAGDAAIDVLIISGNLNLLEEFKRYREIKTKNIISTQELMDISGISPGPRLGKMILLLEEAQFLGHVKGRSDAIAFINKKCNKLGI